ncbi:hypothetical protein CEXT_113541 [Caerostris extrusa]|uniref:Uncharacterized protein n=1 Tax=Caerostris extrusa TaxID=172846 RepID=A0AAV4YB89_CAEEX|nr:hypothetical protein CEXT_113541 [Caerostris extrusa]
MHENSSTESIQNRRRKSSITISKHLPRNPATISHLAEGADFNSLPFTNRNSTFHSSTFPPSTDQERHWDVNSSAGTDVRYTSSNTVQNENFDYFNSSQGLTFPAAQIFENSGCTSGAENPAMAFFTEADISQPCINNIEFMQHYPNLYFYNQLPANSQDLEDHPTI